MNRQQYSIHQLNTKGILLAFIITVFSYNYCCAQNYLFRNGKTDYSIVLSDKASNTERYAAKELQTYIKKVSNTDIKIIGNANYPQGKSIFIGWSNKCNSPKYVDDDESFTYKTDGNNIFVYGGRDRGTMYGVYTFLERELGIHWYTPDYTYIPKLKQYKVAKLNHTESPSFSIRFNLYYGASTHMDWAACNKLNSQWSRSTGSYGEMRAYWGCHSFGTLIPANKYFSSHPEYFSIYKGKRVDNAQLCLSNKSMQKVLINNLKEYIKNNPGYWCYDVSQNDNKKPCECKNCQALVKKYGGESGAMLWFVNQVAKEIQKTYPDVYIGTFAYQYTRKAPTSDIKPNDNVVIRLCNIECCMAHPLTDCEQNTSFINDLNDWKKIAKQLYIWDYTTGFQNYLLPFPNFNSLSSNYKLFAQSNVIGILEEGQRESEWGEFSELKQWIISKLMWNSYSDIDSLAQMFIKDYYGDAAEDIQEYYDLCNNSINTGTHFTISIDSKSDLYSDSFIEKSTNILSRALTHSKKNHETLNRTKRIAAQIYYLKTRRNFAKAKLDGSFDNFKNIMKTDNTYIKESAYTFDMMMKEMRYR